MAENQPIIIRLSWNLILPALALAMGVAAVVLSILESAETGTLITLLGIGLFAIAVDALNRGRTQ
jgi:lipopolysaccharide export LptBFGC system permease protein LptF